MPRFLVTAGNTRERIDRVRDWGNIFTGNTGLAIARALSQVGDVDLLTSNRAHLEEVSAGPQAAIHASGFSTHAELKGALAALLARQKYGGVFMTAAVSDYRPAGVFAVVDRKPAADLAAGAGEEEVWRVRSVQAEKVKSTHAAIAVLGEPTEKIIDLFRSAWNYRGVLVKFKLEVGLAREQLLRVAEASRQSSGADYLVANTLEMVSGPAAGAYLLSEGAHQWVPRAELPARMARLVTST